jgi:uncharacterized protein YecE (DUF72 family)
MADVRIGISGWRYQPWRGVFYPEGLPQREELAYAARQFNSIEINGSFYSLQRPEFYRRWYEETPQGFVFSVKAARFITHMKKLRDVRAPVANFFASGVLALEEKLGPILWQFPESLGYDERFAAFFEMLPHDTFEAAALAKGHDARLAGRSYTEVTARRPLRHAVEVRSPSCCSAELVELLRKHDIALVIADTAGRWPYLEDVTADFAYIRLHGDKKLYVSGYSKRAISRWAERIRVWKAGKIPEDAVLASDRRPASRKSRDVYAYFDNDVKVYAPFDAIALSRELGLTDSELVHPGKRRGGRKQKPITEEARSTWQRARASS